MGAEDFHGKSFEHGSYARPQNPGHLIPRPCRWWTAQGLGNRRPRAVITSRTVVYARAPCEHAWAQSQVQLFSSSCQTKLSRPFVAMGCNGSKAKAAPMAETRPDPENDAAAGPAEEASPLAQEVAAAIEEEQVQKAIEEAEEKKELAEAQAVEDTQEEEAHLLELAVDVTEQQETDALPELVKSLDRDAHDDGETVTTAPKEDDSIVPGEDKLEEAPDFPLCRFCRGW